MQLAKEVAGKKVTRLRLIRRQPRDRRPGPGSDRWFQNDDHAFLSISHLCRIPLHGKERSKSDRCFERQKCRGCRMERGTESSERPNGFPKKQKNGMLSFLKGETLTDFFILPGTVPMFPPRPFRSENGPERGTGVILRPPIRFFRSGYPIIISHLFAICKPPGELSSLF